MQKESTVNGQPDEAIDEELIDTLIAISVVAKRLAANLRKQNTENGGKENLLSFRSLIPLRSQRSRQPSRQPMRKVKVS